MIRSMRVAHTAAALLCGLTVLAGCARVAPESEETGNIQIRIENISTIDFTDVKVGTQTFGAVASGATSDYKAIDSTLRYASLELTAQGKRVTGQTLNFGADRFTWRIDVVDLDAGQLAIAVVADEESEGS